MSTPTIKEVDAAVRSVLATMFAEADSGDSEPPFAGRLLSLRHAEILASRSRQVRLAPGTVITPLARDYLKHQGIPIQWVSVGTVALSARGGEWGFVIPTDAGMLVSLRRHLLQRTEVWHDLGTIPDDAARWVRAEAGRGAVVLTDEAAVVAWRANQVADVRAASVGDALAVAKAARSLGANLLVIEPPGKSIYELLSLFATFRRSGPPAPPAWLDAVGSAGVEVDANRRGHWSGDTLAAAPQPASWPAAHRLADVRSRLAGGLAGAW